MLLIIVSLILFVVFVSTRFGFRSSSKSVRILSYIGVFLSIALMVYLLTVYIAAKFTDN